MHIFKTLPDGNFLLQVYVQYHPAFSHFSYDLDSALSWNFDIVYYF